METLISLQNTILSERIQAQKNIQFYLNQVKHKQKL